MHMYSFFLGPFMPEGAPMPVPSLQYSFDVVGLEWLCGLESMKYPFLDSSSIRSYKHFPITQMYFQPVSVSVARFNMAECVGKGTPCCL